MSYCEYVNFDNLETIQEKCLKLFPNDMLKEDGIFYNKKDLEFLTIDELKSELKKLNLLDRVRSIGFNVTQPNNLNSGIHVDSGQHTQSLNIPLQNCENTFINHFKTEKSPIEKKFIDPVTKHTQTYYEYDEKECDLISSKETNLPYLIDTKTPHNISSKNDKVRIALLIRLKNEE